MAETWIEIKDKREVIDAIVDDELDGIENKNGYKSEEEADEAVCTKVKK